MASAYLIDIDVERVAANRAQTEGTYGGWDPERVQQWLLESGFTPTAAGWMCDRYPLHLLRPGEFYIVDRYS